MKLQRYFIFLFFNVISLPFVYSQKDSLKINRPYSICFSISNNGQIDRSINDFYRQNSEYLNSLFNTPQSQQNEIKYNLSFLYSTNKGYSVGLKLGFQPILFEYEIADDTREIQANANQRIYNFNPAIGRFFSKNNFEFLLGLELPMFYVDNYVYNEIERNYRYSSSGVRELQYITDNIININGGYVVGINGFVKARYIIANRFFISAEISAGMMYSKVGDKFNQETTTVYYGTWFPGYPPNYVKNESDYTFKKTYFSSPEIGLGIGIKF